MNGESTGRRAVLRVAPFGTGLIQCPVCNQYFPLQNIASHADGCASRLERKEARSSNANGAGRSRDRRRVRGGKGKTRSRDAPSGKRKVKRASVVKLSRNARALKNAEPPLALEALSIDEDEIEGIIFRSQARWSSGLRLTVPAAGKPIAAKPAQPVLDPIVEGSPRASRRVLLLRPQELIP